MNDFNFDLTPDPKVLIALTHTPIQPLDALCELIDNSIDSFNAAKIQGIIISNPTINVELPKLIDIDSNNGVVRITDNGPGLTKDMAEKAIKAGFSGNNPYDSLGLFGMGFNIASGKMGSITTMVTARDENDHAIKVCINLEEINKNKNYNVIAKSIYKLNQLEHGTIIEISNWWPEGNPNRGFIKKLVQYGNKKIREELGRRYSTMLRENNITIQVNGINCDAFEHCIWNDSRYVERQKHGKIHAVFRFDKVIFSQKRCSQCMSLIQSAQNKCLSCNSNEFRTIEERIRGWVGIQRYDDLAEFGIDLIRNGRAIRISEKSAFFEYVDEFKKTIKDYPVDSNFGRIVGEVHINHVPVDFLKQDFQRSSPEWQRAISFLRGESSLQPKQEGTENNNSPIYKLFQGYRKVKTPGKTDMYMGYWDPVKEEPRRITRDVEKQFLEKFKNREPGYYDDAEWWKKVEEADKKPVKQMPTCPDCGSQNIEEAEFCVVCNCILNGKECINEECKITIPFSSKNCHVCGKSQEIEVLKPWICSICSTRNISGSDVCDNCEELKGAENHLSFNYLVKVSNKDDSLSIDLCTVELADNTQSSPIKINVYITTKPIKPNLSKITIPVITFKENLEEMSIFIDKYHRMFRSCQLQPEQVVANEIAERIYTLNRTLNNKIGIHTIPNITWQIIEKYWADDLEDTSEDIITSINYFFETIQEKLGSNIGADSLDCYNEMTDSQKLEFANNLINYGNEIGTIKLISENGEFFKFVSPEFVVNLFNKMPHLFFDNKVWEIDFLNLNADETISRLSQERTKNIYKNCLDDLVSFLKYKTNDAMVVQRTKLSLRFLQQAVID